MRTVKSEEDLRRLALARGAEADVGGSKFNVARLTAAPARAGTRAAAPPAPVAAPPVAAPPAPAPSGLSRADVDALLAAQARQFAAELAAVREAFVSAIQSIPPPDPQRRVTKWRFEAKYGERAELLSIEATPKYD